MSDLATLVANAEVSMDAIFGTPDPNGNRKAEDQRQRRVTYWRKSDHPGQTDAGWITTGPHPITNSFAAQRFASWGWKYLDKYGYEVSGLRRSTDDDEKNSPLNGRTPRIWEATHDQVRRPLTWLEPFFRMGGLTAVIAPTDGFGKAGEYLMPATQLVALNLHLNPEVVRVRPDLLGAVTLTCPERCIDESTGNLRTFSGIDQKTAQSALDQHMQAKHKASEGTRSVGAQIAEALERSGGMGAGDIASIAAVVAEVLEARERAKTEPPKPTGPRYPEGFPDETWSRQQLMAYSSDHGYGRPEDPMRAPTSVWLDWVISKASIIEGESDPNVDVLLQDFTASE